MSQIKRVSNNIHQNFLQRKVEERFDYSVLTDEQTKDFEANRELFIDLCKSDWKFFVNNILWIQDPESEGEKEIPFLLYDYQEKAGDEIVAAIVNGYDLPVEKCRKLGLTWLVLAILYWGWHFHEWDCLLGSRKAEEVDKRGDIGSLMEKIRFMIRRTPKWIFTIPLTHYLDKVMMIVHPQHRASIVGEGNNPDFGRSDRRKVAFLDEFTSWEQTDKSAWQGLSATTKCRIPVSTPNRRGVNCFFYEVIKDAKKKDKPYLSLTWDLHPEFSEGYRKAVDTDLSYLHFGTDYTSEWLEHEIRRAADLESVAQEILINYEASMTGKVFGEFKVEDQVIDDLEYDPNLPLYVAWDFGLDSTAMLFIQPDRKNRTINIIDEYQNDGTLGSAGDNIYHYLDILDAKGYKSAIHYGDPHSGENRSLTSGQSNAQILRRSGIIFRSQRTRIVNRVKAGRNMLAQVRVSSKCTLTIEMFTSWQMRKTMTGSGASIPDHSEHSHIGEAFTYFAWNYSSPKKVKKSSNKVYERTLSGVM